ncbi:MAG TPA: methyltransferase domain-containing protein [Polyangiaceae bacterium]|jgi:ubiquinone/menaquinone biosynthesis C-methylase UbiE
MSAPNPAEAYEKVYVPTFFAPLGRALLDRVKPTKTDRVLDVACGTGILGRLLQERSGASKRFVGVDINPAMVEVAGRLSPDAEYRAGNATELGFDAGEFELVLCQHGLMFFPDRAKALREMRRVVTAGGRLGLSTWRSLAENPVSEALTSVGRKHFDGPLDVPFSLGDEKQLAAMIESAGFSNVQIDIVEVEASFPDAAMFVRMNVMAFSAVMPQLATMNETERAEFISVTEAASAELLARFRDGNGLRFPVRANVATAIAG